MLLLAWKFSCIDRSCFFVGETDAFGRIVVWATYTSHMDRFTPWHAAFGRSATCLSVFLELLPGLMPLAVLWRAGWNLEKAVCMSMTWNCSTTMFGGVLAQILCVSGIIYNFSIWPWKIQKLYLSTRNFYILGENTSEYCGRVVVGHVHASGFL